QGSLFFLPKGARNRGYKVDESNIGNIEIIRMDKTKHDEYFPLYKNREIIEKEREELLKKERETKERERQERNKREKQEREDRISAEIESAKASGNFEEIKQEVIEYYNSFGENSYSESFVNNNVIP